MTEQSQLRWTDERLEAFKKMAEAGESAATIGERLGVTRNAVIGKSHRSGILLRQSKGAPKSAKGATITVKPRKRRPKPNFATIPSIQPAEPAPKWEPKEDETPDFGNMALLDLNSRQCHWPRGEGTNEDPFRFCGRETVAGFSYCAGHARMAYRLPVRQR